MANIEIDIAGRRHIVGCADGEENHLLALAARVDRRARDAVDALGNLTATHQLLYAALFLADDLEESPGQPKAEAPVSEELATALESLADRVEQLASRLEG